MRRMNFIIVRCTLVEGLQKVDIERVKADIESGEVDIESTKSGHSK